MVSLSSYRRNYLIFQCFRYSPHELNAAEYDFEIGSKHANLRCGRARRLLVRNIQ